MQPGVPAISAREQLRGARLSLERAVQNEEDGWAVAELQRRAVQLGMVPVGAWGAAAEWRLRVGVTLRHLQDLPPASGQVLWRRQAEMRLRVECLAGPAPYCEPLEVAVKAAGETLPGLLRTLLAEAGAAWEQRFLAGLR
jgi:hypothetical protein